MLSSKTFLSMTTAIALVGAPMVAFGQTAATPNDARGGMTAQAPGTANPADGTPGNPPSTATQRAVDSVTGNRTSPDGTGNNPPGTAAGRAVDRATDGATTQGRTGATTGTTTGTSPTGTATGSTATGATSSTMSVDSASIRGGRRASRIIGSNIYNDENNSIGEVDDLIFQSSGGQMVAVVSVGGFLGIGAKLVAIPYDRLTHDAERNRWMLPGATKDSLQSLPAFEYDTANRRG
ncbi:PRC-barrel domain-containing protein [Falsiroseomonas sp. HC035]|uniref:PRC-barrel domain-containing protein n=1 Tax=Falsiroseomonas sp. HC035 TaxID=3390999 RepID=UPI003D311293